MQISLPIVLFNHSICSDVPLFRKSIIPTIPTVPPFSVNSEFVKSVLSENESIHEVAEVSDYVKMPLECSSKQCQFTVVQSISTNLNG